jgi:two-component sensor histidine kinase/HAMP domain-containing protein
MRLSIRAQILTACLAVILPLAAVEIYYLLGRYPAARQYAITHARQNAQAIAAAAAAFMVTLQDGALVLAQEAKLAGGDPRRIQPILERMGAAAKTQAYVAFILPGGRVAAAVPREIVASGLNVANRPFFQALRAGGEWRPINLTQSPVRGIPVWGVGTAVREGNRFLGAVSISVPARDFDRLIPTRMPAGSWSIVDGRAQLVYLNGVAEIPWEARDRSRVEVIQRALSGEEATSEEFAGPDGQPRIGASVPIRPFGWAVEVSEPASQVLAQARTEAWIHGSKYGPALAIALLIALFIANRIGAPLQRLTAAADRITQGDYAATARPAGPPELMRLMASFNTMSANIARRHKWDEALKAIGRVAASRMPLGEILAAGLEAMLGASGATLGLIRLVNPATRELVVAAYRDLPPSYLEVARSIPWGAKLAGSVAATGEPWLVGQLQKQPEVSHLSLLADRVHSLACLPLKTHDRVVGTITLGHGQPEYFGAADLPVLLQAASLLAGAIVAEQLHATTIREAEEKTLLFRELDHRVRNNLAALISLLHLAAEGAGGPAAETLGEMAERVARLADVHNLLAGRGAQPVEVRELAEVVAKNVLAAIPGGVRIQWRVIGIAIRIPPSQVTPVALVLNELLTNCAKHAFPGRPTGSLTILVAREGDQAVLEVRDDGAGLDLSRVPAGLGLTIVRTLATQNLKGSVTFSMAAEGGTVVRIRFPQPEEAPGGGAI